MRDLSNLYSFYPIEPNLFPLLKSFVNQIFNYNLLILFIFFKTLFIFYQVQPLLF